MLLSDEELTTRAKRLRLLLFDVDGVFTDGTISLTGAGDERKVFSIHDGSGVVWAQRSGLDIGLLSGRESPATTRRAAELGIRIVVQGQVEKRSAFLRIANEQGLDPDQIAYMGDDLLDLPVLTLAGVSAAPGDACDDVRRRVHYVTTAHGGHGAVREFIEKLLRSRDQWSAILNRYLA